MSRIALPTYYQQHINVVRYVTWRVRCTLYGRHYRVSSWTKVLYQTVASTIDVAVAKGRAL